MKTLKPTTHDGPTLDMNGAEVRAGDIVEDDDGVFGVVTYCERDAIIFRPLGHHARELTNQRVTAYTEEIEFCYRPEGGPRE